MTQTPTWNRAKGPLDPPTSVRNPLQPLPLEESLDAPIFVLRQRTHLDPTTNVNNSLSFQITPACYKDLTDPEAQLFDSEEAAVDSLRQAYPAPLGLTRVLLGCNRRGRSNGVVTVWPFPIALTKNPDEAYALVKKHGTLPFRQPLPTGEPFPEGLYQLRSLQYPGSFYKYGINKNFKSRRSKLRDLSTLRDRKVGIFDINLITKNLRHLSRNPHLHLDLSHRKNLTRSERSRSCFDVLVALTRNVLLFLEDPYAGEASPSNEVFFCRHRRSKVHKFLDDLQPLWPFLVYHLSNSRCSYTRSSTECRNLWTAFQAAVSRMIRTTRYRGFHVEKSLIPPQEEAPSPDAPKGPTHDDPSDPDPGPGPGPHDQHPGS